MSSAMILKKLKHIINIKLSIAFIFLILLVGCRHHNSGLVETTDGIIDLKDSPGKWLVINYWAHWCSPCLEELPELNAFHHKHKKKVLVIGVNFDHMPFNKIKSFQEKYSINFPMAKDFPIEKYGVKDVPNLPMTFIIAPNGTFKGTLFGPQTQKTLEKALEI